MNITKINLKKATDYLVLSLSILTSVFLWMFHNIMTVDLELSGKTKYIYYGGIVIFCIFNFIIISATFEIRDHILRKIILSDAMQLKIWYLITSILIIYSLFSVAVYIATLNNHSFLLNMSFIFFIITNIIITVFNPYFQRKTYLKKQYIYLKTS